MAKEQIIDLMENQIKPKTNLNALLRLYHLAKKSGTRPFFKKADLNTISMPLLSIKTNTHALSKPFLPSQREQN